jgi:hypothetical protein
MVRENNYSRLNLIGTLSSQVIVFASLLVFAGMAVTDEPGIDSRCGMAGVFRANNALYMNFADDLDAALEDVSDWDKITSISAEGAPIRDEHLETIAKKAINVESLLLNNTSVSASALGTIGGLKKLKVLSFANTAIDDDALRCIRGLTDLEILYVNGTKVTNEAVAHLRHLPKLRVLDISDTAIKPLRLRELKNFAAMTLEYSPQLLSWEEKYLYESALEKSRLADEEMVRHEKVLREGIERERVESIAQLSELGLLKPSATELMRRVALKDVSLVVRAEAVRRLGWKEDRRDNAPVLIEAFRDRSRLVRLQALEALSHDLDEFPEVVELLIRKGLHDLDEEVAEKAATLLEHHETHMKRFLPEIEDLKDNPNADARARELAARVLTSWDPPAEPPTAGDESPFE